MPAAVFALPAAFGSGMNSSILVNTGLKRLRGMTLPGARQRMKDNKEATLRNFEIVERLRSIREELIGMKEALDAFTYEDVEALKENLMKEHP